MSNFAMLIVTIIALTLTGKSFSDKMNVVDMGLNKETHYCSGCLCDIEEQIECFRPYNTDTTN
jgi:hypothetical protein